MKPRLLFGVLAAALFLVPSPPVRGANTAALLDNPVIVRGKGIEIRQLELDDSIAALKATLASQNQAIPPQEAPALRERMLERIILTRMLLLRATPEDQAGAKALADKFIADTKSKAPSEASYRRQLIATGIKPEDFEARALEQAIVEKVINRELKSQLTVSDAAVREFYDQGVDLTARELEVTVQRLVAEGQQDTQFYRDGTNRLAGVKRANLQRLERPEQVTADLILLYTVDPLTRAPLNTEALAAKLRLVTNTLARLRAGEDFATVARAVSEDPDVARTGGEYTTSNRTPMAPELQDALARLAPNQVSDPIRTPFGIYLARVRQRLPAAKVPFDEAAPELREILLAQGVEKRLPAYAADLRKEYAIEVLTAPAKP